MHWVLKLWKVKIKNDGLAYLMVEISKEQSIHAVACSQNRIVGQQFLSLLLSPEYTPAHFCPPGWNAAKN
jgi:hypothetical protein